MVYKGFCTQSCFKGSPDALILHKTTVFIREFAKGTDFQNPSQKISVVCENSIFCEIIDLSLKNTFLHKRIYFRALCANACKHCRFFGLLTPKSQKIMILCKIMFFVKITRIVFSCEIITFSRKMRKSRKSRNLHFSRPRPERDSLTEDRIPEAAPPLAQEILIPWAGCRAPPLQYSFHENLCKSGCFLII